MSSIQEIQAKTGLFLENPFEKNLKELEKTSSNAQNSSKLAEKFRPKTFKERWWYCNLFAIILGFVCNYISLITSFSIIFYFCFLQTSLIFGRYGGAVMALIPSLILVAGIEVTKRQASNNFLQDVLQFKKFSMGMLSLLLLCTSVSIVSSYFGGKEIPKYLPAVLELKSESIYSLDSVKSEIIAAYQIDIDKQEKRIAEHKKAVTNGKGKILYKALDAHNALETELTTIKNTKKAALQDAVQEHRKLEVEYKEADDQTRIEHKEDTEEKSNSLAYFAIFCEILFFFCISSNWFYSWKCKKEEHAAPITETIEETSNDDSSNDGRNIDDSNIPNAKPNDIGFRKYPKENNDNSNNDDSSTIIVGAPICDAHDCNNTFTKNAPKHRFCSTECRIREWEFKKGGKVTKGKKQ